LAAAGHDCVVVAPSLIPRKPGDRIKTDRRDAINLAGLHRAGALTAVWIPDPAHEAIRDLVRARLAAVRSLRQARQQLSGFLLRHGCHYNRSAWTLMHRRWLAGLRFGQPAHHFVPEDCLATIEAATARRDRLTAQIEVLLAAMPLNWALVPVVHALQALRGLALVAAATVIAEPGDITRFTNPRQLMAYLGLVPSEHSSGGTRRQAQIRGGVTKAGNGTARRMLIEPPGVVGFRQGSVGNTCYDRKVRPKPIRDTAWKAQVRKCGRYKKLEPSRKARHHRDHGNRARTGGVRPGHRLPDAATGDLTPGTTTQDTDQRRTRQISNHLRLSKAGGTVTAGEPSQTLTAGTLSDAGSQTEAAPRRIRSGASRCLRANTCQPMDNQPAYQSMINRRFVDRVSCFAHGQPLESNACQSK
jgi:transposase